MPAGLPSTDAAWRRQARKRSHSDVDRSEIILEALVEKNAEHVHEAAEEAAKAAQVCTQTPFHVTRERRVD